jgi:hypothetical protein
LYAIAFENYIKYNKLLIKWLMNVGKNYNNITTWMSNYMINNFQTIEIRTKENININIKILNLNKWWIQN